MRWSDVMATGKEGPMLGSAALSISASRLIACALWIGLAYGLLEGTGFSLLRLVPWAASPVNGTTLNILWIDPLEYAAAFGLIGLAFAGAHHMSPRLQWEIALVSLLVGTATFLIVDLQDHRLADYASAALACGAAVQTARWYRRAADHRMSLMVSTLPYLSALVLMLTVTIVGGSRVLEAVAMRSVAPVADRARPNVLLLVIDTQRADHLSSYGYQRKTTPRLDQLASEGVLFERAHSPSSWTLPSHSSMMTGRSPHEHRAGDPFRPFLDGRYPTLAEALRDAGYATGGFVANSYWVGRQVGLDRGFIRYEDHLRTFDDALFKPVLGRRIAWDIAPMFGVANLAARQRADVLNRHLLEWLDAVGTRPFFAFVNYMDVHGPYLAPPPYSTIFTSTAATKATEYELAPTTDQAAARMEAKLRESMDGYDGSLAYLDHEIGHLLDTLQERGLASNTLVIVTSDHGESFGEHGLVNHGNSVYLDQTHVPLIMRFPGRLTAGVRTGHPVSLTRLGDTIMSLTGQPHQAFTGSPFVTQAGEQEPAAEESVLTEVARRRYVPQRWPSPRGWTKGLITQRWHFILSETGEKELYDLDADAGELRNIADEPALKSVVAGFQRDLERMTTNTGGAKAGAQVAR